VKTPNAHRIDPPEVSRGDRGIPCPKCNGYADRTKTTDAENNGPLNCGRVYACCVRAFTCRLCKERTLARAEAPEMD
jgi:hypothetical protein